MNYDFIPPPPLPLPYVSGNHTKVSTENDLLNISFATPPSAHESNEAAQTKGFKESSYPLRGSKDAISKTNSHADFNQTDLKWLSTACSKCPVKLDAQTTSNFSDTNASAFTKNYTFRTAQKTSIRSQLKWVSVPVIKGPKDDNSWINPYSRVTQSKSLPKYPEWKLKDSNSISGQSRLSWRLLEPDEVLIVDQSTTKRGRLIPALESMNRSVAFSTGGVGPDIGFLVPPGFRWTPNHTFDASIRGWNRRNRGEQFLAWNNGDAVGQFYLQPLQMKRWSFGGNIGIRSITNNPNNFSQSNAGEGISAGFRFDYSFSDTFGIAFGAEQLAHFDDKTDTGRDIYLVASKGWWLGGKKGLFPLATATAGIGTGYFGRNPNLQFACSNIVDAGIAQVDNPTFFPLCWGPIASAAIVLNEKISFFSEYNNFSLVTGASVSPFKDVPLRATWGATLAQDFGAGPGSSDSYSFDSSKTRWFFRVSVGL